MMSFQLLFHFYISKLSHSLKGISVTSYANHCTTMTSANGIDDMCLKVNDICSFEENLKPKSEGKS